MIKVFLKISGAILVALAASQALAQNGVATDKSFTAVRTDARPVIDSEITMEQVEGALQRMENRQVFGKIVISI